MRELHMPLQRQVGRPRTGPGELAEWAKRVRRTQQPCLLVGIDGALVAISETARGLLGPNARPGMPESSWWLEQFPHAPTPSRERSLLARAAASGTAAHSVVQLLLDDVAVTMQVLVAPLETTSSDTDALLVFLRPVTVVASG
ncbi:MAG TPA: PAS domain-containing protein [Mycobacteriales bacterium]|nr:PAS domain-containing protein [Mycobacteriales bacterium]